MTAPPPDPHSDWREVVAGTRRLTWNMWAADIDRSTCLTDSGRETVRSAIKDIASFLGPSWLDRFARPGRPDALGVPLMSWRWWPANDVEHVHLRLLEFGLRLRLLREASVAGLRAVREDMRGDIGHFAHGCLQVEVAALAMRAGWSVRLEPPPDPARSAKADLLLTEGDHAMLVEARTFIDDDLVRADMRNGDRIRDRLLHLEITRNVRFDGELAPMDDPDDIAALVEWLDQLDEIARRVEVTGETVRTAPPYGGSLSVMLASASPAETAWTIGIRSRDPLRRLLGKIGEKAEQGRGEMPLWLRFDHTTSFFALYLPRDLAARRKAYERLVSIIARKLALYPHVAGLVLSSSPNSVSSDEVDHLARVGGGASVVARTTKLPWWRESLIVPGPKAAHVQDWISWYRSEPGWLSWALEALSLPPLSALFRS